MKNYSPEIIQKITEEIHKRYGNEGLAYYLQGSGGRCIACKCETPPHEDNCIFVESAMKIMGSDTNEKLH